MIYPSTASYPSSSLYPEKVIPNFVFDDDAITIPYKSVTSSDSVALSESINPFVFEPRLDSAAFAEALTLSVDINLFDSAIVTDQFDSITFDQFDSAAFAESIGPLSVDGPHEHIYVGETVNAALESTDSGSAQDFVETNVFIEDSITLSEFVNDIAFAQTDAAQATDALIAISTFVSTFDLDQTYIEFSGFITADGPGLDHMHWGDDFDYQFIATTLSTTDDPIVSEDIPNIEIPLLESLTVSEFISLSLIGNDSLAVADALASLTIFAASQDEFIYQELFELTTDTNVSEVIAATDASLLTVDAVGNENIALGEFISIAVSVADSGNLTEIVANAVAQSDSLNFVENRNISLTQSDLALLTDLSNINVNATTADSANLTERDNFIDLIGNQTGQLIETPFYQADYARLDYIFLISEIAEASILKQDFDFLTITETKPNILLNGAQLITFKEKVAIGKAAPLILNINDNPTVHGSVTGDIIIISTGGTEPVLL